MSQRRVRVCLFSPLGEALVLGPADRPETFAQHAWSDVVPWREPAPAEAAPAAIATARQPEGRAAPRRSGR
jgi:hypothetical protein